MKEIKKKLIIGVQDYMQKTGLKKAVVGLSGGLDSSVVIGLVVEALGAENVHGLLMPYSDVTSKKSIEHAKKVAKKFNVKTTTVKIDEFIEPFTELPWDLTHLAAMNTMARVRAVILYNYANSHNALVMGTSNKSEILLGYGTKYGDLAADIFVIGDLFKTKVIELAKELEVPEEIIEKAPTAELFEGQTDEKELGAPYSELDKILSMIDEGVPREEIEKKFDPKIVDNVIKRLWVHEHKRKTPPIIRV